MGWVGIILSALSRDADSIEKFVDFEKNWFKAFGLSLFEPIMRASSLTLIALKLTIAELKT